MGDKILYESSEKTIDENGVIIERFDKKTIQVPKQPQFMQVFTKDIGVMKEVSTGASKLLFGLFKYVDNSNKIFFNNVRKDELNELIGIRPASQAMYLTELVKKEIIIREGRGMYILNPYIFGKGSWAGIRQLRTTTTYDFENLVKTVEFEQQQVLTGGEDGTK